MKLLAFVCTFFCTFIPMTFALEPSELRQVIEPTYIGKSQDGGIGHACKVKLADDTLDNLQITLDYPSFGPIKINADNGIAILKTLLAPALGAVEVLYLFDSKQKLNAELTIQSAQIDNVAFVGASRLVIRQNDRVLHTCEYLTKK